MDKNTLLEILDKSAMSLAGLEFIPVYDENDEIVGAQLMITTDLVDPLEDELTTTQVIEKHLLSKEQSLNEVLNRAENNQEEEE